MKTQSKTRRPLTAAERAKVAGGTGGSGFIKPFGTRAWIGANLNGQISSI